MEPPCKPALCWGRLRAGTPKSLLPATACRAVCCEPAAGRGLQLLFLLSLLITLRLSTGHHQRTKKEFLPGFCRRHLVVPTSRGAKCIMVGSGEETANFQQLIALPHPPLLLSLSSSTPLPLTQLAASRYPQAMHAELTPASQHTQRDLRGSWGALQTLSHCRGKCFSLLSPVPPLPVSRPAYFPPRGNKCQLNGSRC